MKALTFLGTGSSFAISHTSAVFTQGNDITFIDMSMLNVKKAMKLHPEEYDNVYIFITHMHDDHVSGLGSFIFMMYYMHHKKPIIVVPENLFDDVIDFLRLTGVSTKLFKIEMAEEFKTDFFKGEAILVKHSPELKGKCFSYVFFIDGKKVVYSGDMSDINDISHALLDCDEFYCEVTTNPNVKVHLYFDDIKDTLLKAAENGTKVYLMHYDDYDEIIKCTKSLPVGLPIKVIKD